MAVSFYRPKAVAHRFETGWARARPRSRHLGWTSAAIVVANAVAFAAIVSLVR